MATAILNMADMRVMESQFNPNILQCQHDLFTVDGIVRAIADVQSQVEAGHTENVCLFGCTWSPATLKMLLVKLVEWKTFILTFEDSSSTFLGL